MFRFKDGLKGLKRPLHLKHLRGPGFPLDAYSTCAADSPCPHVTHTPRTAPYAWGPWIAGGGGGITAATAADGSVEWLLAQSFVPHATVWSAGDTFAEGGLEQHYSVMKSSRDRGATWTLRGFMSRPYDVLAAPVVVRLADGTLRAFFSDRKNEAIYVSDDRRDDGRFWQLWPTRTRLPSGPVGRGGRPQTCAALAPTMHRGTRILVTRPSSSLGPERAVGLAVRPLCRKHDAADVKLGQ
jgi:hypothetical protein